MKKVFLSMLLAVILLVGSQVTQVDTDTINTSKDLMNIPVSINGVTDPGQGDVG